MNSVVLTRYGAISDDLTGQPKLRPGRTWLKEMRDLPGTEEVALLPEDVVAVNAIVARLRGQLRQKRVNDDLAAMREVLRYSNWRTKSNPGPEFPAP